MKPVPYGPEDVRESCAKGAQGGECAFNVRGNGEGDGMCC